MALLLAVSASAGPAAPNPPAPPPGAAEGKEPPPEADKAAREAAIEEGLKDLEKECKALEKVQGEIASLKRRLAESERQYELGKGMIGDATFRKRQFQEEVKPGLEEKIRAQEEKARAIRQKALDCVDRIVDCGQPAIPAVREAITRRRGGKNGPSFLRMAEDRLKGAQRR